MKWSLSSFTNRVKSKYSLETLSVMFKKLWNRMLIAIKAIPDFLLALLIQLLNLIFVLFFYSLSLVFLLLGLSIICGHTYIFLKKGAWAFTSSPDLPFTVWLEAEWAGAWKIYSWLPSSIILMLTSVGIYFLFLKLKTVIQKSPADLMNSQDAIEQAGVKWIYP